MKCRKIVAWFTNEEYAAIERAARDANTSLARFVRGATLVRAELPQIPEPEKPERTGPTCEHPTCLRVATHEIAKQAYCQRHADEIAPAPVEVVP